MKKGGAPTSRKECGRLAKQKEAMDVMDSEAESQLESLRDSDSEVGKAKGDQ